ncbi:hypothetical protein Kpol_182p4 [Vanderwaltozyma polyspora DSM 70294]|uniref:HIG1 domain-containing protein n=1 Tax=Vanderwaltozyma polyspora (strain ATCC 22028 / DSM 70294 / BCRC 21397 / CBS 2163 / NBRC 10782 / NRRL Y-8283 / UCD 57-17) TaxID=436907 RepID=A7TTR4_VANPO|nr:uncharacterized protein Kpol_182p4 [Vanderwaltozyma polyspora DSM 70294]EDO14346.1 hypothetical protein Kpol_182p4 [Vanderwaltozyma polyspora DSM 70294]
MGNQVQPVHYDSSTVNQLSKDLVKYIVLGGLKGAAIGISTAFLLRRYSTLYRTSRIQVRTFYHIAWISYCAYFTADGHLITFQKKYFDDELKRRKTLLDEAAEKGVFLEEEDVVRSTIPQPNRS